MAHKDIVVNPGSTLYTLQGCVHCEDILEDLVQAIEAGFLKRAHCNPEGSKEEKDVCDLTDKLKDFGGFPSIYDKDGKRVY